MDGFEPCLEPEELCPKCGLHTLEWRMVTSSDEAHEDVKYHCTNPSCGHSWWVDGCDS